MRIPPAPAPFIYFRFAKKPGAGSVLLRPGRNKDGRVHFSSVVTRLHALAIESFWPGHSIPEPELPEADKTDGAMRVDSPFIPCKYCHGDGQIENITLVGPTGSYTQCQSCEGSGMTFLPVREIAVNLRIFRDREPALIYRNRGNHHHCAWSKMQEPELAGICRTVTGWMRVA
jgi:hypothetical protein